MKIFNTETRSLVDFAPADGRRVRLYTCGPTVYDFPHIGNLRTFLFEDLLRRTLQHCGGWSVCQVMNLTDVDDKTIRGAKAAGLPLADYTAPFKQAFFEDLQTLRVEPSEHYPAATDHIPEMIALIEKLVAGGHAYRSADGSVYFRIASFPRYGRLAGLDLAGLKPGARVAGDEYEKDNAADFALWKAWREEDGAVAWDSPWGRGRPGWHIECSAMSMRYLGETFDLHTGGVDNVFPHHEDEIAQSECATGHVFARYWMHANHLIVDGRKMSKSLGNFLTLRGLLAAGHAPRAVRFVLLAAHYRQQLNFTFDAVAAATTSLERIDAFARRLDGVAGGAAAEGALPDWAREADAALRGALETDLNTPCAYAALFGLVTGGNRAVQDGALTADAAAAVRGLLRAWDRLLGFVEPWAAEGPDAESAALLEARGAARAARDFAEADRLRDVLLARGWAVKDTPQGPVLRRAGA